MLLTTNRISSIWLATDNDLIRCSAKVRTRDKDRQKRRKNDETNTSAGVIRQKKDVWEIKNDSGEKKKYVQRQLIASKNENYRQTLARVCPTVH